MRAALVLPACEPREPESSNGRAVRTLAVATHSRISARAHVKRNLLRPLVRRKRMHTPGIKCRNELATTYLGFFGDVLLCSAGFTSTTTSIFARSRSLSV